MTMKHVRVAAVIIILAIVASIAWILPGMLESNMDENAAGRLEDAVRQAAVACYSTEGMYPATVNYLEENYGLRPDDRFAVKYVIFASNLPPEITVIRK